MDTMQEVTDFKEALVKNGFKEDLDWSFSNGEVNFYIYGSSPYRVVVKRLKTETALGISYRAMIPSTLGEVFDSLPENLRSYIIYIMNSFEDRLSLGKNVYNTSYIAKALKI